MFGGQTDEKQVEYYVATLDAKLNGYEAILSKQKYIAGDVSTLPYCATACHLPHYVTCRSLLLLTSSTCHTAGWRLRS